MDGCQGSKKTGATDPGGGFDDSVPRRLTYWARVKSGNSGRHCNSTLKSGWRWTWTWRWSRSGRVKEGDFVAVRWNGEEQTPCLGLRGGRDELTGCALTTASGELVVVVVAWTRKRRSKKRKQTRPGWAGVGEAQILSMMSRQGLGLAQDYEQGPENRSHSLFH